MSEPEGRNSTRLSNPEPWPFTARLTIAPSPSIHTNGEERFMTIRQLTRSLCVSILAATAAFAHTQSGTIEGTVKGPDGAALADVEIAVSGGSVMGTKTAHTNASGEFRFPSLLPGDDYDVAFSLTGFRGKRYPAIVVLAGQTTSLAATLEIATVTAEIDVEARSPVLDVVSPTASTHFESELLEHIPNVQRDWAQTVLQAPGIVDASEPVFDEMYSSRGGSAVANQAAVDGVINTIPVNNVSMGSGTVFESIEDVQVVTGALPAEIGNVGGAYVNVITKSGGNEFSGQAEVYYESAELQSDNVSDALSARGLTTAEITDHEDFGLNLGGPIAHDKAWFNVAYARKELGVVRSGFPFADLKKEEYASAKVTWQPAASHTITALYNTSDWELPYTGASATITPEATVRSIFETKNYKAAWTGILSQNMFVELHLARRDSTQLNAPQSNAGPAYLESSTGKISGGNVTYFDIGYRRDLPKIALNVFAPDWHGSHQFKVGLEYENSTADYYRYGTGPQFLHLLAGGRPLLALFWNQADGVLSKYEMEGVHAYAQDSWSVTDHLTLSLGARVNTWEGSFPRQSNDGFTYGTAVNFPARSVGRDTTVVDWTSFEPRLGASYALDAQGRTVLRAAVSRYHHGLDISYFASANPNGQALSIHPWADLDGDLFADPNEVFAPINVQVSGGPIASDLKNPYTDEITVGVGREVFRDAAFTLNATWRQDKDLIDDVNTSLDSADFQAVAVPDRGLDGVAGTSDDRTITVFNQVRNLGRPATLTVTNPDGAEREYKGVEAIFSKRSSGKWQGLASVAWQESTGTLQTNRNDASGVSGTFNDFNTVINNSGPLIFDTEWQAKLLGTYLAPYGFSLSGYYLYQTGAPLYRTVNVTLAQGPVTVIADPRDTHREDDQSRLDLRVDKSFRLFGSMQLGLSLDVFNVFNDDAVTNRNQLTESGFSTPLSIQPPRTMRLGARVRF
jgi:Carboxypeptidase regulatory-like domain